MIYIWEKKVEFLSQQKNSYLHRQIKKEQPQDQQRSSTFTTVLIFMNIMFIVAFVLSSGILVSQMCSSTDELIAHGKLERNCIPNFRWCAFSKCTDTL
jgi:hypothetical protein